MTTKAKQISNEEDFFSKKNSRMTNDGVPSIKIESVTIDLAALIRLKCDTWRIKYGCYIKSSVSQFDNLFFD